MSLLRQEIKHNMLNIKKRRKTVLKNQDEIRVVKMEFVRSLRKNMGGDESFKRFGKARNTGPELERKTCQHVDLEQEYPTFI